jgi:hypothetical protein
MVRVLAPGGRIVIGDSVRDTFPARLGDAFLRRFESGHVGLQTNEGFERLLTGAGIGSPSSRPVMFGLYAFVGGTKRAAANRP